MSDELAQWSLFDVPTMPTAPKPESTVPFHPARFTVDILEVIADRIPAGTWVHDCFAGTGERLGALADRRRYTFSGTESEPEFILDPRVRPGDATDPATYPTGDHVIVTSPAYGNGMADNFAAKDPTKRNTYRAALHRILGYDRPLHPNNMGQYGYRAGRRPERRAAYWSIGDRAVACWTATRVFVNVKDFISGGIREYVVDEWAELLEHHGYRIVERIRVDTPGNRFGANRDRVDHEMVLVGQRRATGSAD